MLRKTCVLLLFPLSLSLSAQLNLSQLKKSEEPNLVPDGSFELSQKEPCGWNQGLGKFDQWMQHWYSPTQTTPDLFSTRVRSTCWSHPSKHSSNRQRPKDGDNMVGIKVYGTGGSDTYWHEYVQVALSDSLIADSLYYIEFYANASQRASRISNNIGALVHKEDIRTRDRKPLYITPSINSEKMLKQSLLGWKKISGVIRAKGGEKYLTIGNFYRDEETLSERLETGRDGAYYYIDDVSLRKAKPGARASMTPRESRPHELLVKLMKPADTKQIQLEKVDYQVGTTLRL